MRVLVLGLTVGVWMFTGVPVVSAQKDTTKGVRVVLMGVPDVDKRAPDFSLPWANREGVGPIESPYQLASDRGRTVVVAFYPRDFTSGCTAEFKTFAQQYLAGQEAMNGISAKLGYATPSSFTRWFHNEFGTSPRAWRDAQRTAAPGPPPHWKV